MFERFHDTDKEGEWLSCIKSLTKGDKKNLPIGMASLERLPLRHLRVFIDDFVSDTGIDSEKLQNMSGKRLEGFVTRNRYRKILGKATENKSNVQVSIQNEVKIPRKDPSEEKLKLLEKKLQKLLETPKPVVKKLLKFKPKDPQTLKKKVDKLEKQLKSSLEFQEKVEQQLKEMNVLTSLANTKLDMQFLLARMAADKSAKPETPSTDEARLHAAHPAPHAVPHPAPHAVPHAVHPAVHAPAPLRPVHHAPPRPVRLPHHHQRDLPPIPSPSGAPPEEIARLMTPQPTRRHGAPHIPHRVLQEAHVLAERAGPTTPPRRPLSPSIITASPSPPRQVISGTREDPPPFHPASLRKKYPEFGGEDTPKLPRAVSMVDATLEPLPHAQASTVDLQSQAPTLILDQYTPIREIEHRDPLSLTYINPQIMATKAQPTPPALPTPEELDLKREQQLKKHQTANLQFEQRQRVQKARMKPEPVRRPALSPPVPSETPFVPQNEPTHGLPTPQSAPRPKLERVSLGLGDAPLSPAKSLTADPYQDIPNVFSLTPPRRAATPPRAPASSAGSVTTGEKSIEYIPGVQPQPKSPVKPKPISQEQPFESSPRQKTGELELPHSREIETLPNDSWLWGTRSKIAREAEARAYYRKQKHVRFAEAHAFYRKFAENYKMPNRRSDAELREQIKLQGRDLRSGSAPYTQLLNMFSPTLNPNWEPYEWFDERFRDTKISDDEKLLLGYVKRFASFIKSHSENPKNTSLLGYARDNLPELIEIWQWLLVKGERDHDGKHSMSRRTGIPSPWLVNSKIEPFFNMMQRFSSTLKEYDYKKTGIHEHLRVLDHPSIWEQKRASRGRGFEEKRIGRLAKKNNLDHNTLEDVLTNLNKSTKQARNRATTVYKRAYKKTRVKILRKF